MKITDTRIKKILARGRHRAIIKDVAGRRMLIGFEPSNPLSRKRHVKLMTGMLDLAELGKETKDAVEASAVEQPTAQEQPLSATEQVAKAIADQIPPPPKEEPKPREITQADKDAMAAAQAKRDRKNQRKSQCSPTK